MWREEPSIDVRTERGGVIVLRLIGDHDLATKPSLVAELAALPPEAAVVIDLTDCTFVDSTVIGAILNARRPERTRVSLVLPPDTSYVMRALSVLGVSDLMPVHPSIEAALEAP